MTFKSFLKAIKIVLSNCIYNYSPPLLMSKSGEYPKTTSNMRNVSHVTKLGKKR